MSQTADSRTGIAAGLAVGLASAAVLGVGVIMLYLLFRKDRQPLGLAAPQPINLTLGYPQVPEQSLLRSSPTQVPVAVTQVAPRMLGSGPTLQTVTVPAATPVWVATASSVPCRVTIRPVAPVAGFVVLAYNSGALQGDEINQSNGFIVPVGQEQVIRLLPKQSLFARSIVPPSETVALLSVSRAEAPGDI